MKTATTERLIIATLAALALNTAPVRADPGPAGNPPADPLRAQQTVSYGDLNLASSQGRAVLARRVEAAARQVCGTTSFRNAGGLRTAAANRRCVGEAIAAALDAMDVSTGSLASAR